MGTAKPPTKETTVKTSSQVRSSEQTTAPTKSKEVKASKIKSPGIPTKKSAKPSDKTSPIKESSGKNPTDKLAENAAADVPGSTKIKSPEVAEPGEIMSPEEAEQARKRYLLQRFWISGRGFWGKRGDRMAWIASVGLLLLIIFNVAVQYGITAVRLYWRGVKAAQNWCATSISCPARAGAGCSIVGCGRGRHSDCAADYFHDAVRYWHKADVQLTLINVAWV